MHVAGKVGWMCASVDPQVTGRPAAEQYLVPLRVRVAVGSVPVVGYEVCGGL